MKTVDTQYCRSCDMTVPAERTSPNHALHIILSIITAGLWLFVYLFVALFAGSKRWRCQRCGNWTDASPRTIENVAKPGFGRVAVAIALITGLVAVLVAANA